MPPKFTPRAPQVGRYWPGKPLKDDEESSSDEDDEEEEEEIEEQAQESQHESRDAPASKLVTTMKTTTLSEQGPYAAPEEESSESESEEEEEEPSQPEKRTSKVRQPHRRAIGEFHAVDKVDLEEESSEDEESEEESSEEEILPRRPLMRPTFVPKNQRDQPRSNGNAIGLANYGAASETAGKSEEEDKKRKEEAIKFVENEMRNAAQAAIEAELNSEANRGIEEIDDTDDLDPIAEKEAWKLRELQRLKRERESLIARELEREELEKRRNMDESERLKEDYARKREIEEEREKNRGTMEFMQKYYHKGAYYQDEEILKRNYNVATAEEHRQKEALPKSLQIRDGELGRASRTKWTHLSAEDTSKGDSPWFDKHNSVNKRTLGKMGGMHDPNDRERKRRRS